MLIRATLYNPATQARVTYENHTNILDKESADYMWTEGNYRCDCNRIPFMREAQGLPRPDWVACGHTVILERLECDGEAIPLYPDPSE